ncbi:tRNA (adenine(22)-N(1))-methyltransferase [Thermaerobacter marianensis]|uniref:tRNA (adenine(22)-N(1))-methyltransferase n=1 Tax=Thermaerobacter marianensis TaxID=73919 RepID=UPI00145C8F88|nr:class I SAM-dependent methyltransferase [Thermaerobacter marianensis]
MGPRLEHILKALGEARVLADVGTDRALLPVAAVQRGQVKRAIATDLRAGPLEGAHSLVCQAGVGEAVQLRQGPGLEPLAPGEADAVVIAGLHGETIAAILRDGRGRLVPGTRLLLQPTRGADTLRLPALAPRRGGLEAAGPVRPQDPAAAALARNAPSAGPMRGRDGLVDLPASAHAVPAPSGPLPVLTLEGESLVAEGRHTYVLIAGRVAGAWGAPTARDRSEFEFIPPALAMVDEPAFIWWWDRPTTEAAGWLAELARRSDLDPWEAVARVGPALLVARGGQPDPLLGAWLEELARPWRRALRANTGSTSRAAAARHKARAWVAYLQEVARQTGVKMEGR